MSGRTHSLFFASMCVSQLAPQKSCSLTAGGSDRRSRGSGPQPWEGPRVSGAWWGPGWAGKRLELLVVVSNTGFIETSFTYHAIHSHMCDVQGPLPMSTGLCSLPIDSRRSPRVTQTGEQQLLAVPGPSLLSVSARGPVLQTHTSATNGATCAISPFMDGVYFLPPIRSHYQQTLQMGILIVGTPVWGHTSKTFRFPGPLQAPLAPALQSQRAFKAGGGRVPIRGLLQTSLVLWTCPANKLGQSKQAGSSTAQVPDFP